MICGAFTLVCRLSIQIRCFRDQDTADVGIVVFQGVVYREPDYSPMCSPNEPSITLCHECPGGEPKIALIPLVRLRLGRREL